jgi:hypothetical protein
MVNKKYSVWIYGCIDCKELLKNMTYEKRCWSFSFEDETEFVFDSIENAETAKQILDEKFNDVTIFPTQCNNCAQSMCRCNH